MTSLELASGDNHSHSPRSVEGERFDKVDAEQRTSNIRECKEEEKNNIPLKQEEITTESIGENETKLKERVAQCRNIIESLKMELSEEKIKLQKESKTYQNVQISPESSITPGYRDTAMIDNFMDDLPPYATSVYGACVDSKLNYDENLMEYEKQLQKYQNTLNMAQMEKKNAIRKQMLTKAYRLKLLEVENQCNIELLRVKQSLQCLEPLQMIASKWKTNADEVMYDYNNFELIPRYPELATSVSDNTFKDDADVKLPVEHNVNNDDCNMSYDFKEK